MREAQPSLTCGWTWPLKLTEMFLRLVVACPTGLRENYSADFTEEFTRGNMWCGGGKIVRDDISGQ